MYGDSNIHRIAISVGVIGLVGLMPYNSLPMHFAVALAVLPLVIMEAGAGMADSGLRRRSGLVSLGRHIQSYGALLYVTPFIVFSRTAFMERPGGWYVFVILAGIGSLSCLFIISKWLGAFFGYFNSTSKLKYKKEGIRSGIEKIVTEPLLLGGLYFLVITAVFSLWYRGRAESSMELLFAAVFLAAGVLMTVAISLEKWESRIPFINLEPLHESLVVFSVLGVTALLFLAGISPKMENWLRIAFFSATALALVIILMIGIRRVFLRSAFYRLDLFREGLLERSGHGALLYPWKSVLEYFSGFMGGHEIVLLMIDDSEPVSWKVLRTKKGMNEKKLIKIRKKIMASNSEWLGADLFVRENHLGMSPESFISMLKLLSGGNEKSGHFLPSVSELEELTEDQKLEPVSTEA